MQMVVFSIVFGEWLKVPTDNNIAYPVFSSAAVVPWSLFGAVLGTTATSLTSNAGILNKVYFPRLLIPLAGAAARLVDFGVAFVILLGMIFAFGIAPDAQHPPASAFPAAAAGDARSGSDCGSARSTSTSAIFRCSSRS